MPVDYTMNMHARSTSRNPDPITRMVNGCSRSYAWIYNHYYERVYEYAQQLTRDHALSEDIVQEVFYKLWMNRSKLAGVSNFDGYFFAMYRNQVYQEFQRLSRIKKAEQVYAACFDMDRFEAAERLLYKETQERIEEAGRTLSTEQQLIFWLKREQGWKQDAIASYMGHTPASIKGQVRTVLKKIKKAVEIL